MNTTEEKAPLHISLADASARLRAASSTFITLLQYADCSVELFAPQATDTQQPHAQDELYIISAGTGTFRRGENVVPFVAGDVLFVPAHTPHRFDSFTEDFETWVVFFGPNGGSKPQG